MAFLPVERFDRSMTTPILLATGNPHKVEEFSRILAIHIHAADPGVEETGLTFEENALIKARALCAQTGQTAMADDSGLEVDALDGAPGVYSARFAGEHGNDAANNAKLLAELESNEKRTARFVCVIAVCHPDGEEFTVRGTCEGRIARAASGDAGFGYDPLFVPEGYAESFAALGSDVKSNISHRANALALLKPKLDA